MGFGSPFIVQPKAAPPKVRQVIPVPLILSKPMEGNVHISITQHSRPKNVFNAAQLRFHKNHSTPKPICR